jgi:chaperonin GroES
MIGGCMFNDIRPLYDRVLVKRVQMDETTPSGLVIPPTAQEKAQTGQVVAVGQGRVAGEKILPLAVKAGDIVYFGKYAGTEAGDEHIIIREDEILGVIEKK